MRTRTVPLFVASTGKRIDPAEAEQVAAEARRVLNGNRQSGISDWDGMRYDFVCPSPTHYPFQWFWDSAFHAIALLHIDNVSDLRISIVPDQSQQKTPDLAFKIRVMVPRNAQGQPDLPNIVIEHPLFNPQTIHLDQALPDCKLTKAKDEVDIAGDCLKLSKRSETPAFQTQLVQLPEH